MSIKPFPISLFICKTLSKVFIISTPSFPLSPSDEDTRPAAGRITGGDGSSRRQHPPFSVPLADNTHYTLTPVNPLSPVTGGSGGGATSRTERERGDGAKEVPATLRGGDGDGGACSDLFMKKLC
ncbi:hypothetical protein Hanom_Chr16g01436041 [Helianthus anomalus]